jgi:flagellar biosynthesis/type III secretory pathway protein FliH
MCKYNNQKGHSIVYCTTVQSKIDIKQNNISEISSVCPKEGRKEEMKEERKEGRKEGRKKGRKEGRKFLKVEVTILYTAPY